MTDLVMQRNDLLANVQYNTQLLLMHREAILDFNLRLLNFLIFLSWNSDFTKHSSRRFRLGSPDFQDQLEGTTNVDMLPE